jgi:long-chain fatty acid transport protein
MHFRGTTLTRLTSAMALSVLAAGPAGAAGFSIFEHGSKAMGMAGAFTAQADDGSAMFHNVAGLAFQKEQRLELGTTLIKPDSEFRGQAPFPGPTARAEQASDLLFFPSHAYWVKPLNPSWTFGFGLNSPFGLTTEWDDPDNFVGRYVSTKAELRSVDLNPSIGWQITPNFGIGFGAIARFSDVTLERRVPFINPLSNRIQDAGKVVLESDLEQGYGFNVGMLHKYNNSFSWGLSYRSKVKIEYGGSGRFTQISTGVAGLDALLRTRIPFDQDLPIETEVEYPDQASLGFALAVTPNVVVETDFNWTGWSSFDKIDIRFTENPAFSSEIPENYEDVYNYRLGIKWTTGQGREWRFGYVFDETPQPEEAISPLLPDGDRTGYTIGYGHKGNHSFDVALMYLPFDERTRDESFEGEGDFFGTYETTVVLLGLTYGF